MFVAQIDGTDELIAAEDAQPGLSHSCPVCDERVFKRAGGDDHMNRAHFYHEDDSEHVRTEKKMREPSTGPSDLHAWGVQASQIAIKRTDARRIREVQLERQVRGEDGLRSRPDVIAYLRDSTRHPAFAVEVQLSPIKLSVINERTVKLSGSRIPALWVYPMDRPPKPGQVVVPRAHPYHHWMLCAHSGYMPMIVKFNQRFGFAQCHVRAGAITVAKFEYADFCDLEPFNHPGVTMYDGKAIAPHTILGRSAPDPDFLDESFLRTRLGRPWDEAVRGGVQPLEQVDCHRGRRVAAVPTPTRVLSVGYAPPPVSVDAGRQLPTPAEDKLAPYRELTRGELVRIEQTWNRVLLQWAYKDLLGEEIPITKWVVEAVDRGASEYEMHWYLRAEAMRLNEQRKAQKRRAEGDDE